jgi:ProP effector
MSTKISDTNAAILLLAELFPQTFAVHEARQRPLKVDIHTDIISTVNGAIKPHELVAALRTCCNNPVYLARLRVGAVRVGLDGMPADIVTAEAAKAAAEKLAVRLLNAARKKPTPPAVPTLAGPKRITLRDLRELAQMRRQTGAGGE